MFKKIKNAKQTTEMLTGCVGLALDICLSSDSGKGCSWVGSDICGVDGSQKCSAYDLCATDNGGGGWCYDFCNKDK